MKLVVFSDSHGRLRDMREVMERHRTADCFIHLGDGNREFEQLCSELGLVHQAVRGNCDFACGELPISQNLDFDGCRVFFCHGHEFFVKHTTYHLVCEGVSRGAKLIMYGHTHIPEEKFLPDEGEDGIYLLNPGSIATSFTYALVDIVKNADGKIGILTSIARV